VIDVRESWEYATASIHGSYHIPMGEIPARARRELSPEEHLVIVCHHGVRSMNVAIWLQNQGYKHVQSMRGGIESWSATVDPAVPHY
jgi:rhodanese-related sulfurtransferase